MISRLIICDRPYSFALDINVCNSYLEVISLFDAENTCECRGQCDIERFIGFASLGYYFRLYFNSRHNFTMNFVIEFDIKTLLQEDVTEFSNKKYLSRKYQKLVTERGGKHDPLYII